MFLILQTTCHRARLGGAHLIRPAMARFAGVMGEWTKWTSLPVNSFASIADDDVR
jgi:hypothetical protein